ncbi:YdeI/OmpD-associated family protein [Brachybacterium sp. DNPG3]
MAASTASSPPTPITATSEVVRVGERLIVPLPAEASAQLPSRGQVAAEAVLNGHELALVVEPDGRKGHWLNLDDALRSALALSPGDAVEISLTPTKAWPEPEVPADLGAALDAAPDIRATWADITPMARWEWVRWVGATRSEATRAKRVEVSIDKMRHGKRRPCCFDLSSCTDPELARSGKLIGLE